MNNKVGFRAFFRAYQSGYNVTDVAPKIGTDYIVAIMSMLAFLVLMAKLTASDGGIVIRGGVGVGAMFMLSICVSARIACVKPSVFNLLPMGYKRKAAYFLLSIVIASIVVVVMVEVGFVALLLVMALIGLLFTGEWMFVAEEDAEITQRAAESLQGSFLLLGIFLCVVGLTLIIAFLRNRTARNILLFATPFIIYFPLVLFQRLAGVSGDMFVNLEIYPCSELLVALFVTVGAALVAVGAARVFAIMRPKEY